jgi:hypothetical protein
MSDRTYEMAVDPPQPMVWEDYERIAAGELAQALTSNVSEAHIHELLERHPCLLGARLGVGVDDVLRRLVRGVRGRKEPALLLVGYPIPVHVGGPLEEIHWEAVQLPPVPAEGRAPHGFRPNDQGW